MRHFNLFFFTKIPVVAPPPTTPVRGGIITDTSPLGALLTPRQLGVPVAKGFSPTWQLVNC